MRIRDDIDRQIIEVLKANAREKTSEVARRVNRSRTAVEKRIERLEKDGVIIGYNVVLASASSSLKVEKQKGFLIVEYEEGAQCETIVRETEKFDIIVRRLSVYGDLDLILEIEYRTLEELMDLKNFLANHPDVKKLSVAPIIKEFI